jgi:iron complex transport system permease protein
VSRVRWLGLTLAAIVVLAVGVMVGSLRLAPGEVWRALLDPAAPSAAIVRQLRLPRALLGFVVGGGLAVSGAVLQALIRNPLGDPYLLGLSGGAALGAVLVIAAGVVEPWAVPVAAFAGALAALALVYRLSLIPGRRLDPHVLILAGVVVSAFSGAVVSALLVLSEATELRNAFLWMLGGLSGGSWRALLVFLAYAIPALLALAWHARGFDLLALGDEPARHLGADPERLKRVAYLATGLLTAAAVATCGMIGFVGLVVPHAVRRLWGPLHAGLLPAAFLTGGIFLVLADAVARGVAPPLELPVGVVTALVGVPLFALLLRRGLA